MCAGVLYLATLPSLNVVFKQEVNVACRFIFQMTFKLKVSLLFLWNSYTESCCSCVHAALCISRKLGLSFTFSLDVQLWLCSGFMYLNITVVSRSLNQVDKNAPKHMRYYTVSLSV